MSAINDEVQALKLIAEQRDSCAQLDLGLVYLVGDDVQQDFTVARLWLQLAAENGEVDAQFHLGMIFNKGLDVDQDFTQAAKWFLKAADYGHTEANSNMGILYANGLGTGRKTGLPGLPARPSPSSPACPLIRPPARSTGKFSARSHVRARNRRPSCSKIRNDRARRMTAGKNRARPGSTSPGSNTSLGKMR